MGGTFCCFILKLVQEIGGSILQHLEGCEEESCRPPHIRALSNAGLVESIPILLKYAEESKDNTVSEAAIKALQRMGHENIARPVSHW